MGIITFLLLCKIFSLPQNIVSRRVTSPSLPTLTVSFDEKTWIIFYAILTDGPGKPSIVLTPNKSSYHVGEDIRLQCVSDSNPPYYITWSFLPFNHSTESSVFSDEIELKLKDIQLENAGNYTCTAVNEISTNNNNVVINVKEHLENNKTTVFSCDQCGHSEICHKKNGEEYCVTNPWMFVAIIFIFIFLSASFLVAFYFLSRVHRKSILHKSSTKKTSPRPER